MTRPDLHLDWCTYEAAKYAVEHWHYSHRMPRSKLAMIGVWEGTLFVGCIVFGVGAGGSTRGGQYGLADRFQVAELVRVALKDHAWPVSRMLSIAVKIIHKKYPNLKLLVSFADTEQGHIGGIYQGQGWIYLGGKEESNGRYIVNGESVHPRVLHLRYGFGGQSIPWLRANIDKNAVRIKTPVKHKYVYPLDREMRERILPLAQPYPKRAGTIDVDGPATHAGQGGSSPTPALQITEAINA